MSWWDQISIDWTPAIWTRFWPLEGLPAQGRKGPARCCHRFTTGSLNHMNLKAALHVSVQCPALSRTITNIRWGQLWLCSAKSQKTPGMEIWQPLWVTCSSTALPSWESNLGLPNSKLSPPPLVSSATAEKNLALLSLYLSIGWL